MKLVILRGPSPSFTIIYCGAIFYIWLYPPPNIYIYIYKNRYKSMFCLLNPVDSATPICSHISGSPAQTSPKHLGNAVIDLLDNLLDVSAWFVQVSAMCQLIIYLHAAMPHKWGANRSTSFEKKKHKGVPKFWWFIIMIGNLNLSLAGYIPKVYPASRLVSLGLCSSQPLPNEKWPGQHGWWKKKIPANLVMKIKFRLFGDDYICLKGIWWCL